MKIYYRTEAKEIQSWILASDRLLELRGGSNILVDLDEAAERLGKACGAEVLVAAAGGATLEFHDHESLRSFAEHWPLYVWRRAPGLHVVQAWDDDLGRVYEKLGAERNLRMPDLPVAGPLVARSGRTGLPAVQRGKKDGLEDRIIRAKLKRGEEDRLRQRVLGDEKREFVLDGNDFDEGYVAVIHIDGNGIGERIRNIEKKSEALKTFSDRLKTATTEAARQTFQELVRRQQIVEDERGERDWKVQARPIVLGGDDLTVIVAGRYAIPFTVFYLRAFEEATKGFEPGLTACAGIALVKSGWPFSQAHKLAEDLCKSAKRALKPQSGLLFHRISTADADLSWKAISESEVLCENDQLLAGGPWLLKRMESLDKLAVVVNDMPRRALREWVGECHVSLSRAQARWDRLQEVAKGNGSWNNFASALENAKNPDNSGVLSATGWDVKQTPIPDALMWANLQPAGKQHSRLWTAS